MWTSGAGRGGAVRAVERGPAPVYGSAAGAALGFEDLRGQARQRSDLGRAPGRVGCDVLRAEVGVGDLAEGLPFSFLRAESYPPPSLRTAKELIIETHSEFL